MKHATTNAVVADKPTQHLWFWQRRTPRRKPGEPTKTVVFQGWGAMSTPRKTSATRAIKRLDAERQLTEGQIRDLEIGINPVYRGHPRNGHEHKAWMKRLKDWEADRRRQRQASEVREAM